MAIDRSFIEQNSRFHRTHSQTGFKIIGQRITTSGWRTLDGCNYFGASGVLGSACDVHPGQDRTGWQTIRARD